MIRSLPLVFLLVAPITASDLSVAPGESIQLAIDSALDGDRVLVQPGTYFESLNFVGKSIEVIGVAGAQATVLDAGGINVAVRFQNGEGPDTRLRGFTVTGGFANFGAGGIACASGSTPAIADCIVRNNRGKFGGGVSGSPMLTRCSIVDNLASLTHGGGVYGAPQMSECVIASNSATSADGGGLYLVGGPATLIDCVVIGNGAILANSSGGGIYIDSTASVSIERTIIADNFATGGAFAGRGGGIYAEALGSELTSCTVVGNTISGSSTFGAGVFGPISIRNSIVRDNVGAEDVTNAKSVSYSDITGGYAGTGNVDLEPLFVDAGARDLHLLAASPLIDIGDPSLTDPDGSRSDMGAHEFQTLYAVDNVQSEHGFDPVWKSISAEIGGAQGLLLQAGAANAGFYYQIVGSLSGTSPGFDLLGTLVPLNLDAYFLFSLTHPNQAPLEVSAGTLNLDGAGAAHIAIPAGLTGLVGLTAWHAAFVADLGAGTVVFASNAEPLEIVE